ncbi:lysine methyltransferase domain-containing protein [Sarocladium implicatum]|nr:lysine methyltransferase domain-containing protein [Sarocladium implicatum]
MHYIRLLRAPQFDASVDDKLQLVLAITTDLGDALLSLPEPMDMVVLAQQTVDSQEIEWHLSRTGQVIWRPGSRVVKPTVNLPRKVQIALLRRQEVRICIRVVKQNSASSVRKIVGVASTNGVDEGLVMPAWYTLRQDAEPDQLIMRRLEMGSSKVSADKPLEVEILEEIGQSIARHFWDGGVTALSAIAATVTVSEDERKHGPCVKHVNEVLSRKGKTRILELGCGVGTLGIGIATLSEGLASEDLDGDRKCTILMTDVEEAESTARSNMALFEKKYGSLDTRNTKLSYFNLDWEEGRHGRFVEEIGSEAWDLIVLADCTYNSDTLQPLVDTLSALHDSNRKAGAETATTVFIATKPRHDSERAFLGFMQKAEWSLDEKEVLPLPLLGREPESVELYLYSKA